MRSLLVALVLAATFACARSKAAVESSTDPGATGAPAASGSVPPSTTPAAPPPSTLPPPPPPPPEPMPGRSPVAVEMRNVDLHITDTITLHVKHLDGRFVGTGRSGIPYLDDARTYEVVMDSAAIVLDMASLNALLNEHVLGHGRSNVENLTVGTDSEGRLVQKGEIAGGFRGGGVPVPNVCTRVSPSTCTSVTLPRMCGGGSMSCGSRMRSLSSTHTPWPGST